MLSQRIEFRRLVKLAGEDRGRVVLQSVQNPRLEGGINLAESERGRRRAHQAQTLRDDLVGKGADSFSREVGGRVNLRLAQDAAGAEIIGPADDLRVGAGSERRLERLGGAGV